VAKLIAEVCAEPHVVIEEKHCLGFRGPWNTVI
jgi:hypothetical protein